MHMIKLQVDFRSWKEKGSSARDGVGTELAADGKASGSHLGGRARWGTEEWRGNGGTCQKSLPGRGNKPFPGCVQGTVKTCPKSFSLLFVGSKHSGSSEVGGTTSWEYLPQEKSLKDVFHSLLCLFQNFLR